MAGVVALRRLEFMTQVESSAAVGQAHGGLFRRVLCATDGSQAATEAVRQAAVLAGPEGEVTLIAVAWRTRVAATEMAELSPWRAETVLADAGELVREAGARATTAMEESPHPDDVILGRAEDFDLLAVGAPPASRIGGILLSSVASAAAHRATVPLLVARPAPDNASFPTPVLIASDAEPGSWLLIEVGASVARTHHGRATLVHAIDDHAKKPSYRYSDQAVRLYRAAGVHPHVHGRRGKAHELILDAAAREATSLIVMGSRGLDGVRALGSVSERVVHRAPCSVLIVRPQNH
jgi:nucleotide-binding universal stress UspA family protein